MKRQMNRQTSNRCKNKGMSGWRLSVKRLSALAAALGLCISQGVWAAENQLTAVLSEVKSERESAIVWIDASWGSEGLCAGNAVIGADKAEELLPGVYEDVLTAGDSGFYPYGAKLVLQDAAGSLTGARAAVWTDEGGQDDLQWISMRKQSSAWRAAFSLTDSDEAVLYRIHVYGEDVSGDHLLGGIELTVKQLNVTVHSEKRAAVQEGKASEQKKEAVSGDTVPADFDALAYYCGYPDLQKAIGYNADALYRHYLNYGMREGRSAVPQDFSQVFDAAWYLEKYPDLRQAFGTDTKKALIHFVCCGMNEGRIGTPGFDVRSYRNAYPDLRTAFGNNMKDYYLHYLRYGIREGRTIH